METRERKAGMGRSCSAIITAAEIHNRNKVFVMNLEPLEGV